MLEFAWSSMAASRAARITPTGRIARGGLRPLIRSGRWRARKAARPCAGKESEPMLRRRRRPLMRAAMIGGAGYVAGKKMGQASDGGAQGGAEEQQVASSAPVD